MTDFLRVLHSLKTWDSPLPSFDPASAPAEPLPLFHDWFAAAAAAGQTEPHAVTVATADEDGRPDVRTVLLHDADARGWHFASHATSAKGRQLAARPEAALGFYWPVQARQVRVRGHVVTGTPEEAYADLHARTTGALASALVARQSEVLDSPATLEAASEAAWRRAEAEPDAPAPTWTLYIVEPSEIEFFQGDPHRRHIRLRYRRTPDGWTRELLWP
ncbi:MULTISPECIES: pyridoxal 5'-phosphate synthase [unclassified Streptomyces]|uniref:pyridoxine/pyridoxamine 5'-phosphate oxidase n=1 Tax=unclassified Streptomyces TaxID=2593676 RepID=UPI0016609509|nr:MULTISPECIES: pyridoxal 5'-phosphate synthase [unclassified Streptomyces]MBD0709157.1 oxidase [Streptomyces sp. CBMA291]MBD0716329.1 oxidase [Streptomyces sp. CBMA370]